MKKTQQRTSRARPYRVFFDVLAVRDRYWAPQMAPARVVDLGLTDHRALALTGGAGRRRLLRVARLLPSSNLPALAVVTITAVLGWAIFRDQPALVAAAFVPLELLVITQLLVCRYAGARTPAIRRAWAESLQDGTMTQVSVNDRSWMDLRRIDKALLLLQSRHGTRHDAEARTAVSAVLARDRPAVLEADPEPPAGEDAVRSLFDQIITKMTVKTPAEQITELERLAAAP